MRFGLFSNGQGIREYDRTVDAWAADVAEIVLCEQLGMEEAWVSEHRASFLPDALPVPELMITKAAALTERIVMGTAVRRLGFYDPTQVAREAACTDILTDGRYVLGAGSGPCAADVDQHAAALEALNLISRCFEEEQPFDHIGKYYQHKGVAIWPKPISRKLPIAVASTTQPLIAEAARRGWRLLTSQWASAKTISRLTTMFKDTLEGLGQPARPQDITATRGLYIADTDERAFAEVVPALRRHLDYTRKYFDFSLADFRRPGEDYSDMTVEKLIEDGLLFIGSPDTVREKIEDFYEKSGGFGQFLIVGGKDWGKEEQRIRSFELFATKVMPHLRHLGAEEGQASVLPRAHVMA
ncbi:limonene 1,2-monooxygenase [Sphingomonas vulcanisoli]|uniref:Limonene 1,2-monooxygenase n=1 Tax=Sphingomonas vulcanisoli TaxID=1658060 RepID=A0ABX0TXK6_9SPHN|nr:LLM class flavin-dependent oxidoreductase [Sphingomonas vulcanisoli]NIJ08500.1 limonene 1,2-monooxygenase [Sphingomonas vulcanisoli]